MEEMGVGVKMDINELYLRVQEKPDEHFWDIQRHFPYLMLVAQEFESIVEFGCRSGNSTTALLMGLVAGGKKGAWLSSYDIDACRREKTIREALGNMMDAPAWVFNQKKSKECRCSPEMLFVDAWHTIGAVEEEMEVAKEMENLTDIVFHDTELFGWVGQREQKPGTGILPAILDFMAHDWRQWRVRMYSRESNGMMHITTRMPAHWKETAS